MKEMSKFCTFLFAALLALGVGGGAAGSECTQLDVVDIGDPDSEDGHNMTGWGPIEPENSGGNLRSKARGLAVLKRRDFYIFYILLCLVAFCTLFYYFGELVDFHGWESLRRGFFYGVHDVHRLLFLAPIIYVVIGHFLMGELGKEAPDLNAIRESPHFVLGILLIVVTTVQLIIGLMWPRFTLTEEKLRKKRW